MKCRNKKKKTDVKCLQMVSASIYLPASQIETAYFLLCPKKKTAHCFLTNTLFIVAHYILLSI